MHARKESHAEHFARTGFKPGCDRCEELMNRSTRNAINARTREVGRIMREARS